MPKFTQQEIDMIAELNERYDTLAAERREIEYQIEEMSFMMQDIRTEQQEILRQIETLQGEVDFG